MLAVLRDRDRLLAGNSGKIREHRNEQPLPCDRMETNALVVWRNVFLKSRPLTPPDTQQNNVIVVAVVA